ncbi:hypothetical protein HKCCSP123_01545 [Rhodobacterales bacterium HKCCSP123]|nr:hypothetical protein [Rhodobacterales bacterium HKCCSP123]
MRLRGMRQSRNVEDRRGRGSAATVGIGGIGLVIVLAIGYFTGIDVTPLLQQDASYSAGGEANLSPEEEAAGTFSAQILGTTEDVWSDIFQGELGRRYSPPTLVLFSRATQSACGGAQASSGPFYCPNDQNIYLDTAFFAYMAQRMGAGGDFAAAYVIAHEVGHHVQNELGILAQTFEIRSQVSEAESNAISVRVELQADCLAGIWGRRIEGLLDGTDVAEAMNAAERIGDDYLQSQAGMYPNPHSFTHGTSEQRQRWFARGFQSGELTACDTFTTDRL